MTNKSEIQKQFDYAVRQIVKQGCPAYNSKKGCAYRMKKGDTTLKCAVGWLIPDSYFMKYPEHINKTQAIDLDRSAYSYPRMKPFDGNEDLLESLQYAHDAAAERTGSGSEFTAAFLLKAKHVSKEYGLKWNFG